MIRLSDQTFCVLNQDFDVIEYVSKTVVLCITSLKNLVLLGAHILMKCIICATVVLKWLDLLLFKVPFFDYVGENHV